jgi:hypothetical protein
MLEIVVNVNDLNTTRFCQNGYKSKTQKMLLTRNPLSIRTKISKKVKG